MARTKSNNTALLLAGLGLAVGAAFLLIPRRASAKEAANRTPEERDKKKADDAGKTSLEETALAKVADQVFTPALASATAATTAASGATAAPFIAGAAGAIQQAWGNLSDKEKARIATAGALKEQGIGSLGAPPSALTVTGRLVRWMRDEMAAFIKKVLQGACKQADKLARAVKKAGGKIPVGYKKKSCEQRLAIMLAVASPLGIAVEGGLIAAKGVKSATKAVGAEAERFGRRLKRVF